jgi:hypothetical protein
MPRCLRPRATLSPCHHSHSARKFSIMVIGSPDFDRINSLILVEETLPGYEAESYCPVHTVQVFNERYKTIGWLGCGSVSTIWLCQDLRKQIEFTPLKIYINCSKLRGELSIYGHINTPSSQHQGRDRLRKMLEASQIEGPLGT